MPHGHLDDPGPRVLRVRILGAEIERVLVHGRHETEPRRRRHDRGRGAVVIEADERPETGETVERLMGNKPEARYSFIQEHAAFADEADLDI